MNRPAGTAYYHKPRGSWKIQKIYALDGNTERSPLITDTDVYVRFEVTEPLLLSPFAFGSGYGKQGFYGIQAMNFQMVLIGNANRAWRCANFGSTKTVSVQGFTNSQLLFQFLTPHASDMLDPRNVVPDYDVPIFKTSGNDDLPGRLYKGQPNDHAEFVNPEVKTITSANIQLSGSPDKLIICVRKVIGNLRPPPNGQQRNRKGYLHELQQSSRIAKLHDSRATLQKLCAKRSGKHDLGRIQWSRDFLLWENERHKLHGHTVRLHGSRSKCGR